VPLGKTTFQITTSVGQSLQTYDLIRGLNLVFLSRPQTPEAITATCAWNDGVIAAWGGQKAGGASGIWIFKRGGKIGEFERPSSLHDSIDSFLTLGSWVVGSTGRTIEVWKASTYEHYTTLTPAIGRNSYSAKHITGLCHMPTFLNKIFVGTRDGSVEIWNISTG
jgi:U3 small nucleolar RNA-associated protein 21